jgi:hypothetical protein
LFGHVTRQELHDTIDFLIKKDYLIAFLYQHIVKVPFNNKENELATQGPDVQIDTEASIARSRGLFKKMCDSQFLPKEEK